MGQKGNMNRSIIRRFFSVLFALAAMPALRATDALIPSSMAGHWEGSTHVIVAWCNRSELPVSLDISPDGTVAGKIGDAELTNAEIVKKHGWLGREDSAAYLIKGSLKGPIVAAEGIFRCDVFIHIRFEGVRISGGLATSGAKFGGKETMGRRRDRLIMAA